MPAGEALIVRCVTCDLVLYEVTPGEESRRYGHDPETGRYWETFAVCQPCYEIRREHEARMRRGPDERPL